MKSLEHYNIFFISTKDALFCYSHGINNSKLLIRYCLVVVEVQISHLFPIYVEIYCMSDSPWFLKCDFTYIYVSY
jgi:hypothetical protein